MIMVTGYTVAEVAKMLRLSEANVLGKLDRGEILGRKVGRLWRVPPKEFHEKFGEAVPIIEVPIIEAGPKGAAA
jgi:excisionase family DNA binding protein